MRYWVNGYLPGCPDGYSLGRHLRWCPAIAFLSRKIISTFLRALCRRSSEESAALLGSHRRRGRRWHGRVRRTSITWITLIRLVSFLMRLRMRLCSVYTSSIDPQSSPLLIHDASRNGGPYQNAGVAAHLVPRGSVM